MVAKYRIEYRCAGEQTKQIECWFVRERGKATEQNLAKWAAAWEQAAATFNSLYFCWKAKKIVNKASKTTLAAAIAEAAIIEQSTNETIATYKAAIFKAI
jgi:hypothetical protein